MLGDPVNLVYVLGLWFGWDDLVFSGVGALFGVLGQAIHDFEVGKLSGWGSYVSSSVGGAASGEVLLYTGNAVLAGAAGGLISNLTQQGINYVICDKSINPAELAYNTALGALFGSIAKVPVKFKGINSGRG